jgi:hypothetical protein
MGIGNINYRKEDKSRLISKLMGAGFPKPTKSELKELLKKAENAIRKGDFLTARNTLIVSIFYQSQETINVIRKKGLFRYSKYINRKCIVKNIASELFEICQIYGCLSVEFENYLRSIINFSTVLDSYNAFDKLFINEIKSFENNYPGKSLIKTLLSYADYLFLSDYLPTAEKDLSNISGRTKEEISLAASFLIHFYTKRIRDKRINVSEVSVAYIKSNISKLIIPSCYYLDFREMEILIDHFGYMCEQKSDRLLIIPPTEGFEKAIRVGYIRTGIQGLNDVMSHNFESVSMQEFVEELSKTNFSFLKLVDSTGYSRYRLEMPEPVYEYIIENFIKPNTFFLEEILHLSISSKEQLLSFDDLHNITIKSDLTLFEFLKIRRVFFLFYMLFKNELKKQGKIETDVLIRSLIPIFSEARLRDFINKLYPEGKIDSFLDVVCWEPGIESILDLQYQPVLFFENEYLIALSIFANSNSLRNLYASEYKKNNINLLRDGEVDPLVNKLVESLSEASIECYPQVSVGYTDIDVMAIYDNVLFVFECKHSLHPVNLFDLRTTFDYIKKAEKQIDLVIDDFNKGELIKRIEKRLKINLNKIEKIQGTIILSNRLFNGNIFKYPIRNIREVDNMLNVGTMKTSDGTFWLWENKKLSLDFLSDFLSKENKLVNLIYDSLSKRKMIYEFAKPIIEFNSYNLKMKKAEDKMREFTSELQKKEDK